jgi:hypothetical protein
MSLVPFDRDRFIWHDGRLVPWRDAKLHVLTHLRLPANFGSEFIDSLSAPE